MVMASSPWPLSAISKSKIAVDEAKMTRNVALALPARTRATAPASSAALRPSTAGRLRPAHPATPVTAPPPRAPGGLLRQPGAGTTSAARPEGIVWQGLGQLWASSASRCESFAIGTPAASRDRVERSYCLPSVQFVGVPVPDQVEMALEVAPEQWVPRDPHRVLQREQDPSGGAERLPPGRGHRRDPARAGARSAAAAQRQVGTQAVHHLRAARHV